MVNDNHQRTLAGAMPIPASRFLAMLGSIVITVTALGLLTACGGKTTAPPTANDSATIAAANTASAPATSPGTGTPRTPGMGGAVAAAGGTRGFGGLLTPARGPMTRAGSAAPSMMTPGTSTSVRPVTPAGGSTRGASSVASGSAARATLGPNASASSPALDACVLLTGPEASTAMGEPYSQAQNTPESPASTTARLSGYSSASCVFAADASTPQSLRAVQIGTLRRTPATNPPTGSGTYATIDEVWSAVTQQAQGTTGNPSVLMGVGDEAIVIDDTTTPGDEDVYARKGSVLLLVTVTGYDVGARDKAIAVATQAARNL